MRSWTSHPMSPSLSLLITKVGITRIPASQGGCPSADGPSFHRWRNLSMDRATDLPHMPAFESSHGWLRCIPINQIQEKSIKNRSPLQTRGYDLTGKRINTIILSAGLAGAPQVHIQCCDGSVLSLRVRSHVTQWGLDICVQNCWPKSNLAIVQRAIKNVQYLCSF